MFLSIIGAVIAFIIQIFVPGRQIAGFRVQAGQVGFHALLNGLPEGAFRGFQAFLHAGFVFIVQRICQSGGQGALCKLFQCECAQFPARDVLFFLGNGNFALGKLLFGLCLGFV